MYTQASIWIEYFRSLSFFVPFLLFVFWVGHTPAGTLWSMNKPGVVVAKGSISSQEERRSIQRADCRKLQESDEGAWTTQYWTLVVTAPLTVTHSQLWTYLNTWKRTKYSERHTHIDTHLLTWDTFLVFAVCTGNCTTLDCCALLISHSML